MNLQSIAALSLLLILSACTDYAAKMEDDLEEWKAATGYVEPSTVTIGELVDSRDGQTYRTVTIGTQTWMAQNLNYETENSYCYNDDPNKCTKYGRLYTWAAATTACPSGWHLPSTEEFGTLLSAVGGYSTAGKMLKWISGWYNSGNGTDAYAFSALPAGVRNYDGGYNYEGNGAHFWSSTEGDSDGAYVMYLDYYYDYASLDYDSYGSNDNEFSVRCLKGEGPTAESSSSKRNESSSSEASSSSSDALLSSSSEINESSSSIAPVTVDPSTVVVDSITDDRDGKIYKTVTIGSQTWMAENLNYETENSFCYNDDPANCATYGRLYKWTAAATACPTGWHLPSTAEFETLITAVGGQSTAGKMLKSTTGWYGSDNGTGAYAFSAQPAGLRGNYGGYFNEGDYAYFWSSTEYDSNNAYFMYLYYDNDSAKLSFKDKNTGKSARCVKD